MAAWSAPRFPWKCFIVSLIVFPHQLFETNAVLAKDKTVFLIEDRLYFSHYAFHKQKLVLHRASMRAHAAYLEGSAVMVNYVNASEAPTMNAALQLITGNSSILHYIDPVDDWLKRRLLRAAAALDLTLVEHETEMFINSLDALRPHFDKPHPSMAAFYVAERKRLNLLVSSGRPVGGRWSLDADNRHRLPVAIALPPVPVGVDNPFIAEARRYVDRNFGSHFGHTADTAYPATYADARHWLMQFLEQRLERFGAYEDAISATEGVLFHSVLTPMLNIGLLTPREVVDAALMYAHGHDIPLNSLEGFLRQIIGWREFVRGTYEFHGRAQRTRNAFGHNRPMPPSFWSGQTGIAPIDTVIARILDSAYTHHIERLMILSNFMLLCEFSPDTVYRWFMEMFIDAYDWVMVPNVYGMGLHADGGLMMTKPYISSSNYILRMSDFKRGSWCTVWDGLYWRFIAKHRAFFSANPRSGAMVRNLDRMDSQRLKDHIATADGFLSQLA